MLVSNHITLLQSVKLSETDVVAAGVRTRPLRCFAIRVLSSDSCRLRNVIVDSDCRRGGYHRPGPGCRRKVRWRSSSPLSWVSLRSQGRGRPCLSIGTQVQGSKSTWMFPAAGGAVERFAGARPSHYRGSPLTRPRPAMPFDQHPGPGLFAPLISDANKWCK